MVVSDIFDNTPCGWCYLNGGGYWTSSAAFYATGTNRPFTVSGYGSTGPLLQSSPCGSDYGCAWCVQSSKGGGVSFILLPRVDGSSHLPPVVAGPCNSPRAQRGSSAPLGPPPGRPARACAVSLRHSLYLCNQHPPLPPPLSSAGGYCPAGSVSPTTCTAGNYCPAGAAAPTPCAAGVLCTAGLSAPGAAGSCPVGYFCASGSPMAACAAGYFGGSGGLSVSTCSGACSGGYYW